MIDKKYTFSLLWTDYEKGREHEFKTKHNSIHLYNQDILQRDMNENMITEGMQIRNEYKKYISDRLMDMVFDENVIKYRQDIMKDFIRYPEIETVCNTELLPEVLQLQRMEKTNLSHDDGARKSAWRVELLKVYVKCVSILHRLFCQTGRNFESEGIRNLQALLNGIVNDPAYDELLKMIPQLSARLQTASSVTLGINLDNEMRPTEAVLLSIDEKPFKKKSVLSSIFGTSKNDETYFGIGTFYSILKDNAAGSLDAAIMRDLTYVMGDTFKHLSNSLQKFEKINASFLFELLPEIYYYTGGSHLYNMLKEAGLPMCFPEPAPADERVFNVKDIYDVSFVIRLTYDTGLERLDKVVVTNDIDMDDKAGRIGILTGANQGGKTTFTRALGLAQIMFQAGLPVSGTSGRISPCDNVYTHFPELEKNSISEGRLGEECIRLEQILPKLTKYSMILMNESLSSTSHQECYVIATEIMRYLRKVGSRALFATHIHELAEDIPELNKEEGLSDMMSLVAGVDTNSDMEVMTGEGIKKYAGSKRTYKITPMPPQGKSFALDIAKTYGISLEQLLDSHQREINGVNETDTEE